MNTVVEVGFLRPYRVAWLVSHPPPTHGHNSHRTCLQTPSLPPGEVGRRRDAPRVGKPNATSRGLTSHAHHHGWLYPKSRTCLRRESHGDQRVLGRRPQLISTLQREKQCRVRDLPPRDVPGPSPGTVAPAVGPTTPGFFPYLSLPSFP